MNIKECLSGLKRKYIDTTELFRPEFPERVDIELTNHCNYRCIMCPNSIMTRDKGFMDKDLFERIIYELGESHPRIKDIRLNFMGEPLLHPNFCEFLSKLYRKGLSYITSFNSNGMLLSEEISWTMIDTKLSYILFSLDAVTQDTYSRIRIGGDLEIVKANIMNLIELRKAYNSDYPRIVVQFIPQKNNSHELEAFVQFWKQKLIKHDAIIIKYPNDCAGGINDVSDNDTLISENKELCISPYRNAVVTWDGAMVLCCADWEGSVVLGYVNKNSIYDVWNSHGYKAIRRASKSKRLDICQRCDQTSGRSIYNRSIVI